MLLMYLIYTILTLLNIQPIAKDLGHNYYNIPRICHIPKKMWNGYLESIHHFCNQYLNTMITVVLYKKFDAALLNKIVDKVINNYFLYIIHFEFR